MRGPNAATATSKGGAMAGFKQDLLRNLLLGIRACRPFDATSVEDRKRAVKRSADVAMAAARAAAGGGRARWPKAILAAAAVSGHSPGGTRKARKSACKRVVRRPRRAAASCDVVARRLVRSRTMALRKVIPGADAAAAMDDEAVLLRETIDYAVHLRAQVDVLRLVSAAVQRSTFLRYVYDYCTYTCFICAAFCRPCKRLVL